MEDSFTSQLDVVAINKYMGWYHPWPVRTERRYMGSSDGQTVDYLGIWRRSIVRSVR